MGVPIVIVHGWSDNRRSFRNLAGFLRRHLKTTVATIDLADWISMDDEITYRDLRHAMQRAWQKHPGIRNSQNAHIVSHSTGALVVRDWMTHYYSPKTVPFKRHLMLAPANFGSQLAHKGRAWYGRVFKGFGHSFQTGANLLDGLELASSYTWELARHDLFGNNRWYGKDRILSAVLVGNSGYGGVAAVTDEEGSDGTVRISTANLNAALLRLDYTKNYRKPAYEIHHPPRNLQIAFGISAGDNHGSIAFKKKNSRNQQAPEGTKTAEWILKALLSSGAGWQDYVEELEASNRELYANAIEKDEYYHGYQNTVLKVFDDLGNPVEEYLVEFNQARKRVFNLDQFGGRFQRKIIKNVHRYRKDSSFRSFFINTTALENELRQQYVLVELEALPQFNQGAAVGYRSLGPIRLDGKAIKEIFQANRTLLVDVTVPREVAPKAFRLIRYRSR